VTLIHVFYTSNDEIYTNYLNLRAIFLSHVLEDGEQLAPTSLIYGTKFISIKYLKYILQHIVVCACELYLSSLDRMSQT